MSSQLKNRKQSTEPVTGKGASVAEETTKLLALREYQNDDGHFSLVRNFRLADAITLSNGICGVLSIFFSIRYLTLSANLPTPPSKQALTALYLAHLCPILGFGFDALDGKVARWTGGGSLLGQELDSLADLISFGVAPATLAYTLGLNHPLDITSLLLFTSAGLARLARFNATVALIPTKSDGSSKYFTGIPIPSSLLLTASMAGFVKMGWFVGASGWGKGKGSSNQAGLPFGTITLFGDKLGWGEFHLLSLVFLVWAAAMVSKTLKVPKL